MFGFPPNAELADAPAPESVTCPKLEFAAAPAPAPPLVATPFEVYTALPAIEPAAAELFYPWDTYS